MVLYPLGHFKANEVSAMATQHMQVVVLDGHKHIVTAATLLDLEAALAAAPDPTDALLAVQGHICLSRIRLEELAKLVGVIDAYEAYWSWALNNLTRHRILIAPRNLWNYVRGWRFSSTTPPLHSSERAVRAVLVSLQTLRGHTAETIGRVYRQLTEVMRVLRVMGDESVANVSLLSLSQGRSLSPRCGGEDILEVVSRHLSDNGSPGASSQLIARLVGLCAENMKEQQAVLEELKNVMQPKKTVFWTKVFVTGCAAGFFLWRMYRTPISAAGVISGGQKFHEAYVAEPLKGIYETLVRPGVRSGVRVSAMHEDMDSLQRMVEGYALETGRSDYVTDYEDAIRYPIRSVVFGQLLRLMLIQVQKQKVDMNKVLKMTDGILEQHELNFHVMALMPVVLVGGLGVVAYGSSVRRREGPHVACIRTRLRDAEIILNRCCGGSGMMGLADHGRLLLHVHAMRVATRHIGGGVERMLTEDLDELEDDSSDRERRLRSVDRMFRTYRFLYK